MKRLMQTCSVIIYATVLELKWKFTWWVKISIQLHMTGAWKNDLWLHFFVGAQIWTNLFTNKMGKHAFQSDPETKQMSCHQTVLTVSRTLKNRRVNESLQITVVSFSLRSKDKHSPRQLSRLMNRHALLIGATEMKSNKQRPSVKWP